jgi:hypothetical protein
MPPILPLNYDSHGARERGDQTDAGNAHEGPAQLVLTHHRDHRFAQQQRRATPSRVGY